MSVEEKPVATIHMVCGVVIKKDDKILLVQEKQPKVYKKWNLPAGRVDEGESLEQAAIREAVEECGLKVVLGKKLLVMQNSSDSPVLHSYSVKIFSGKVEYPEDEILDAKWFTLDDIRNMRAELRNPEYILGSIEANENE